METYNFIFSITNCSKQGSVDAGILMLMAWKFHFFHDLFVYRQKLCYSVVRTWYIPILEMLYTLWYYGLSNMQKRPHVLQAGATCMKTVLSFLFPYTGLQCSNISWVRCTEISSFLLTWTKVLNFALIIIIIHPHF
jgi:hypothetical protein